MNTEHGLTGLTQSEAARLLEEHGPNALPEAAPPPLWRRILRQFQGALTYLLLFALAFDLDEMEGDLEGGVNWW